MRIFEERSLDAMIADADRWRMELDATLRSESAVIRGLWSRDRLLALRDHVFRFRQANGLSGNMAYNEGTPDHVKIVDKPLGDHRPTRFVLSQFFPWNTQSHADIPAISLGLMRFRNLASGFAPDTGMRAGCEYVSWPSVIQYRRGGDFLAAHRDQYAFQCILVLSQMGEDFAEGGNYYLSETGHHFEEPNLRFGDVLLLKSDLVHGVHPIDPHLADDGGMGGRWMMFCPLAKRSEVLRAA